jgi:hypothetical protein
MAADRTVLFTSALVTAVEALPLTAEEVPEIKPYVDYLDKEQTVQGILCAFCVLAVAGISAKVVLSPSSNSIILENLQGKAMAYVINTLVAFALAAIFFYQQRSELLGLHGYIVLAIARRTKPAVKRADSWTLDQALAYADSYTLWNSYCCGLGALYTAGVEALFGLLAVKCPFLCSDQFLAWLCSSSILAVTGIILAANWRRRALLDEKAEIKPLRKKRRV